MHPPKPPGRKAQTWVSNEMGSTDPDVDGMVCSWRSKVMVSPLGLSSLSGEMNSRLVVPAPHFGTWERLRFWGFRVKPLSGGRRERRERASHLFPNLQHS